VFGITEVDKLAKLSAPIWKVVSPFVKVKFGPSVEPFSKLNPYDKVPKSVSFEFEMLIFSSNP